MVSTSVLLFCAQALLIQSISSQCLRSAYNTYADGMTWGSNALAFDGAVGPYASYAAAPFAAPCASEWAGYAAAPFATSNGGSFLVSSTSPNAPTGVALTSENAYEGALAVSGAMPFLGAVALEGPVPTAGMGGVTYSCGNGNVAILNEDVSQAGYNGFAAPYGQYGAAEFGYGYASPVGYETAFAGPAYGYRGCGY
ncbi:unnamed protein product [Euphydryas editha]|uniref:Uncharacterized protein n=1 Tax=Euphydryas editha TaxID=104508 RepID=A0AAU9TAQ5_EUPED|nr:unnamed protein product [Euphydryas editha]